MAQWKVVYKARLEGHAHAACFVEAETEDQARSAMVQFGVMPERIVTVALHPVDPLAQYEPRPVAR